MKRFLLVLGLCFVFALNAQAGGRVSIDGGQIYTEVIDNVTGYDQTTNVAVTTIEPGKHRLIGVSVMPLTNHEYNGSALTGNSEAYVSLWDAISTTLNPLLIGETEAAGIAAEEKVFVHPRIFSNGVTVRQGAITRVIIEYIKY